MSAPLRVLVGGAAGDAAWPLDRGLLYGDGLFETLRVRHGEVHLLADHQARLAEGCRRLSIDADLPDIWQQVGHAAAAHPDSTLRLQVTRGPALARGYTPTGAEQPRSILCVYPPPLAAEIPATVRAMTLALRLGENPALAGLKHCNRLEQVLARLEMRDTGAFEGLLGSSSGLLVSGTISNVFIELEGELVTPALDRCGVAGVMRAAVLRAAASAGVDIAVRPVTLDAVAHCTSLALSNARIGLVPVHVVDGRPLRLNETLQDLAARTAA